MRAMTYSYSKKEWHILFVCELEDGVISSDYEGNPLVRISVSPKPTQALRYHNQSSGRALLVLLDTVTTQSKYYQFIRELGDINFEKDYYLLEPIAELIKKRADKEGFKQYVYGKKPSVKKKSFKAVEAMATAPNPLEELLGGGG